ncbi:hypothetical protein [Ferrimicrobium sp.]|uniref:hypothetical protein n=1 Tax=Ferrimicrobium sp. TaxID=2926050 RepID=UPI0026369C15|nr:hypothetical protein [Ferrimicrobium sp.]
MVDVNATVTTDGMVDVNATVTTDDMVDVNATVTTDGMGGFNDRSDMGYTHIQTISARLGEDEHFSPVLQHPDREPEYPDAKGHPIVGHRSATSHRISMNTTSSPTDNICV